MGLSLLGLDDKPLFDGLYVGGDGNYYDRNFFADDTRITADNAAQYGLGYDAYKKLGGELGQDAYLKSQYLASKDDPLSMNGLAGLALGAGQLGLGIASFFDTRKTNKLNRDLIKQQIASNKAQWNAQATKMNDLRAWNGQSAIAAKI